MASWIAVVYSVYQPWDPLRVCVVGRTWPPEFYSWITVPRVRELFERMAQETEEDLENIVRILEKFGVQVLRPDLPYQGRSEMLRGKDGRYYPPPQTPRDYFGMIGNRLYNNFGYRNSWYYKIPTRIQFYKDIKDETWPDIQTDYRYRTLPERILQVVEHRYATELSHDKFFDCYSSIVDHVKAQGNEIRQGIDTRYNTAIVTRIGKDLYHGTQNAAEGSSAVKVYLKSRADREFPQYRNHIVDTAGHSDATYCPVVPGLIVSLRDIQSYSQTFPDWEVVYLPDQSWDAVQPFLDLKAKNQGKWWIPGSEYDTDLVDLVESWLGHWTGYVAETVFDVNMLVIDPKNVIVFNHNDTVFEAFKRHGITPHVSPLRHRYFWDGGIHCVTSDLHREGAMQDYFPHRS